MITLTACKACLQIKNVDSDGLCQPCSPIGRETRQALIALLQPYEIKEVTTPQENQNHAS